MVVYERWPLHMYYTQLSYNNIIVMKLTLHKTQGYYRIVNYYIQTVHQHL